MKELMATVFVHVSENADGLFVDENSKEVPLMSDDNNLPEHLSTKLKFNILDIVDTPENKEGVKPYIFYITEVIDGLEVTHKRVAYSSDVDETVKELCLWESRDFDGDDAADVESFNREWDTSINGVNSSSSSVFCDYWREITPAQAEIISLANSF